ncbi:MAG: pyridoxamine 5'-phosphate oxidase family protein [Atopobiaceae bacterium]
MRRAHREIQDPDAIRALIDACHTVRIGCADEEGPYIVPMSFGYDWDEETWQRMHEGSAGHPIPLKLYLHSATEGRKVRCFDSEPLVAIEMDRELGVITGPYACAYSYSYQSLVGKGHIRRVEDEAGKSVALARLMEHMAPGAPTSFPPEAVARVRIWRIDVDELSGKERYPKK